VFRGLTYLLPNCPLAQKIAVIYDADVTKGNIFWLERVALKLLCLGLAAVLFLTCSSAQAFSLFGNLSRRNSDRPIRDRTDYIILHTTEGPEKGSLQKVIDNGEANYFVGTEGRVYKIIDKKKVAYHCGTSMWNGKVNIDNYSIGIEVQGYYYGDLTAAQYASLKLLISDLQEIYNVSDDRVLTHSMVAYGRANKWFSRPHRGRKRCGMLFAKTAVRLKLGLTSRPAYDPDVYAGRLINADPYLAQVLFGKGPEQEQAILRYASPTANVVSKDRSVWDIARDDYNHAKFLYIFPDGRKLRGDQVKDWGKIPVGTKVVIAQ
jgi:N-acetylmuramoyl-L-alanine amidase